MINLVDCLVDFGKPLEAGVTQLASLWQTTEQACFLFRYANIYSEDEFTIEHRVCERPSNLPGARVASMEINGNQWSRFMEDQIQTFSDGPTNKDRQFVNALARGLEILRCFLPGEKYLSNTELAKRTGMPKPTISRLTYTLTKLGYLGFSTDRGQYHLGSGVLSLGNSLLSNLDVRKLARPAMRELAEHSQASVSIGIRDRLDMVYIESCRSSSAVTLRRDVGSRIPIATTAMGKALLCALPQTERDFLMDHIRLGNEEKWPQIKASLEQGFKDYQDHGFCTSVGDWEANINAVGVPLLNPDGEETMAFNCGGPAFLLPRDTLMNDLGPRLVELVHTVEVNMGRH